MNANNLKQTINLRREAEENYAKALLYGISMGQVLPADGLDICKSSLMTENSVAWCIVKAIEELDKRKEKIDILSVADFITSQAQKGNEKFKNADRDNIFENFCFSTYGTEDGVKFFAKKCQTEGLKTRLANKFLKLNGVCEVYGNDLETIQKGVNEVKNDLENLSSSENVTNIGDYIDEYFDSLLHNNFPKTIKTNIWNLDGILKGGLFGGEMVVLAGRPGSGKSQLALQIAIEACLNNIEVLFLSLELTKREVTNRMMTYLTGIKNDFFRNGFKLDENNMNKFCEACETVKHLKFNIIEKGASQMTMSELRRIARTKQKYGLLVIDYAQKVKPDTSYVNSREREVAEISRSIKQLALELDIPVLALAQASRRADENKTPVMSDLRESASLEMDADTIMFLQKLDNSVYGETDEPIRVNIIKGRNIGTGYADMIFHKNKAKFEPDEGKVFEMRLKEQNKRTSNKGREL